MHIESFCWVAVLAVGIVLQPTVLAQSPTLGKPAPSFERASSGELPVEMDTVLREAPSLDADVVVQIRTSPTAAVLEERGSWVRLRVMIEQVSFEGWALLEDPTAGGTPLLSDRLEVDQDAIERARSLLSTEEENWGDFRLFTDLMERPSTVGRWLEPLRRVAAAHKEAYVARYSMDPVARVERPVVLLFSEEAVYRTYIATVDGNLEGVDTGGHSAGGIVAVVVGERTFEEVAALLLHELTHLRNGTAVRSPLPIWLEEGLAEDMAHSRVSADGQFEADLPRGSRRVKRSKRRTEDGRELWVRTFEAEGPLVSLGNLVRESKRQRIELSDLFALEWEDFILTESRGPLYWKAGFLVRFLLSKHRSQFHRFLAGVVEGHGSDVEALLEQLKMSQAELERDYYAWASFRAVKPR